MIKEACLSACFFTLAGQTAETPVWFSWFVVPRDKPRRTLFLVVVVVPNDLLA